ncbi:single-stranded DNA-binding protein [Candidatus Gracilibacteria bacterium CG17_big_fil_post_rev_8_21_14_2_50_48_13]|nr:MAG: single-stranded DNA-binding protein [Candidatus Gracilibacteria bacterium CG17_big_fil_post_rev_8_21_14_2_50_48_13]
MDLNRAQLIGNLTQDPELKQTSTGQNVVSFSVATNRTYTDSSGQKVSQAEFHNIVAWGKLAEIIAQYCKKGKKVYVEGRLQTRSWEDQQGVKHYKTEINAENLIMLDRGGDSGNNSSSDMMAGVTEVIPASMKKPSKKTESFEEEISIEDVPF